MSERLQLPDSEERMVEAVGGVVFASDEPVTPKEIARALGGAERDAVTAALDRLRELLDSTPLGLQLEWIAGGVRIATRSSVGPWVRHLFRQRNRTRLSPAALETLAIIAYRQPVTAPEIQAIRGKDPTAALKGLLDKRLARCLGRKKVVGNPLLYGTSKEFLVHFGLNRLDDLPSIEEFDQFLGVLDGVHEPLEATGSNGAEPLETAGPHGAEPPPPDTPDDLPADA